VRRAPRELKAFANVAIAAGETVEVVLGIDRTDLAYWETRLGRWVVEGGDYHCAVGASSRDLRTTAVVKIPGDDARIPLTPDSTVAEWLADPRGAKLLTEAFAAAPAGGDAPPILEMLADPNLMEFIGSFPLGRMAAFGTALPPETLQKLLAAAND
jgi:beta-glucosidase